MNDVETLRRFLERAADFRRYVEQEVIPAAERALDAADQIAPDPPGGHEIGWIRDCLYDLVDGSTMGNLAWLERDLGQWLKAGDVYEHILG